WGSIKWGYINMERFDWGAESLDTPRRVQELLGLRCPPLAVGFLNAAPAGLQRWDRGQVPAGCAFWQQAMEGHGFYTEPSDYYNCAVGSYTHGIELPAARAGELTETLEFMDRSQYVAMQEVPTIPKLAQAPRYVAYGPADEVTFEPDAVII